jgi:predicted negative regulator of RcsB-dependent stress response
MSAKVTQLITVFVLLCVVISGSAWGMDEAILTATSKKVVAKEDAEFNEAMRIWLKHDYARGEKMLEEFAKKHPDSRWAGEAELHCGCYLTFNRRYDEAREVFGKLIKKHAHDNIRTKATLRLGNVAERQAKFDEAIKLYTNAMGMDTTWDQFRYANFRAKRLIMSKGKLQAIVNCGPVALEVCLKALGKATEAKGVRELIPTADGISPL